MEEGNAYKGMGAVIAAAAVGWVAQHAGMGRWEVAGVIVLVLVGLQMVAGNPFKG